MRRSTRLISVAHPARHWPLVPGKRYIVGRGAGVDVVLEHASVSRQHAVLECDRESRWVVYDLGSHNGTRVNDERIRDHALVDGDLIRIGAIELRFEDGQPAAPATHPTSILDLPPADDEQPSVIERLNLQARPPQLSSEHVSAILTFGRSLEQLADRPERLSTLLDLAISESLGGRWAYALRIATDTSADVAPPSGDVTIDSLAAPRTHAAAVNDDPHLSRSALRAVLRDRGPIIATHSKTAGPFEAELTTVPQARSNSAILCPIAANADGSLDVLYVILPPALASVEWLMLLSLAIEQFRHADALWTARRAAEVRAAHDREMSLARHIQSGTLPSRSALQSIDWAYRFEPSLAVAGDYVDVWQRDDGTVAMIIADVAGKGMQAALVTAGLHAIVHTAGAATPLAALVTLANSYLCSVLPSTSFVTLAALTFDPSSGQADSVNCGHMPMLAVNARGEVRPIEGGDNVPLGISRDAVRGETVQIAPGDWLIGYTDGLTELRDAAGQMLGGAALEAIIREACLANADAESIAAAINDALERYRGSAPAGDDRTLIVVRASPLSGNS